MNSIYSKSTKVGWGKYLIILLSVVIVMLPWGYSKFFVDRVSGYFFLFCILSVLLTITFSIYLIFIKRSIFHITVIDILLIIEILWLLVSSFINSVYLAAPSLIVLYGLIIIYVITKKFSRNNFSILFFGLMIGVIGQTIYGNLQIYKIFPSNHAIYNITGSFFNPAPFAGYLIIILPAAIVSYFLCLSCERGEYIGCQKFGKRWVSILKTTALVTILTIVLVLPATKSRAAWLSVIISGFYILYEFFKNKSFLSEENKLYSINKLSHYFLSTKIKKLTTIALVLLVSTGAILSLYFVRKDSVQGRFLIWKVSADMIKDKPVVGHGINQFSAKYMNYQAEYFKENFLNTAANAAGDNVYAFNEFIKIWTEVGIIGLLLVLLLLYFILFGKTKKEISKTDIFILTGSRAGIIAMVIFSLFSYPGSILPILLNLVILIAIVSGYLQPVDLGQKLLAKSNRIIVWGTKFMAIPLFGLALLLFSYSYNFLGAHMNWRTASQRYKYEGYKASVLAYKKAYPLLKNNGVFLMNYGKTLYLAGYYPEALELVTLAKNTLPNTNNYINMGDCCKAMGKFKEAELAYKQAHFMNPGLFYPEYLLAKLYNENGESQKAKKLAEIILNKEVKVPSKAIDEIKMEMINILDSINKDI